jgi:hypothetical protein
MSSNEAKAIVIPLSHSSEKEERGGVLADVFVMITSANNSAWPIADAILGAGRSEGE